ncbi:hypothetical protein [Kitasatospora sp. NPDC058190]|uniref:hypothetical protein n=1 Tax=Kitasatospora sp. NPDC058190 TaxID=3346371 RepID=UPI0036DBC8AB
METDSGRASAPQPRVLGPPDRPGGETVEGTVRGVQMQHYENGSIWNFLVERYGEAGERVLLVPVEIRSSLGAQGALRDGDWVKAKGRMRSGTLQVKRLENLTTGATVGARKMSKAEWVALIVVIGLILGGILYGVLSSLSEPSFPPGP